MKTLEIKTLNNLLVKNVMVEDNTTKEEQTIIKAKEALSNAYDCLTELQKIMDNEENREMWWKLSGLNEEIINLWEEQAEKFNKKELYLKVIETKFWK